MSRFKVGDKIIRVKHDMPWAPIGYETTALENDEYKDKNSSSRTCIINEHWNLVSPKWSIYNNDLPWEKLSNKQKGKLLLAHNEGLQIKKVNLEYDTRLFKNRDAVYQVINTVKPEPTMAELFDADADSFDFRSSLEFPEFMIAKGWTKPCK